MEPLTNADIDAAGLNDWRKLAQGLHARFRAPDATAAGRFVGVLADAGVELLEVHWRGRDVDAVAATRREGVWVMPWDVDSARRVSELAAEHGLQPVPEDVVQLELALDTGQGERLAPFWAALLTGDEGNRPHGEVFDPSGRVPNVWWQQAERSAEPEQRWHFDVWIAPETLERRIAAAVDAGGRVVEDHGTFVVLADADGNRVCFCVATGRE